MHLSIRELSCSHYQYPPIRWKRIIVPCPTRKRIKRQKRLHARVVYIESEVPIPYLKRCGIIIDQLISGDVELGDDIFPTKLLGLRQIIL